MKKARVLSLLLALVMGLSLLPPTAAAEDTTASVLKLTKTTGTVNVNKSSGKAITLRSDLRLYNGYHVTTGQSSYAWINLDNTKLLKEDAASEVEVRKQGKKLEVNLSAGNVFFDVSEKLGSDESLNISTSTMVAGIRGTSGWVEIESRTQSRFYVLDGSVQCTVSDPVTGQRKLETVDAGEMVECVVNEAGDGENDRCDIIRQEFEVSDIPGSVLTQLVEDVPLCDRILEDSGMDVLAELAKTAGGDPSGRTPDGSAASPEVLGQAQAQQARDEAETAEKLKEIQEEQDKQENSVASDVKWWEPLKATYANGTLTISGKGAIVENFSEFRQNLFSTSRVVIEEGVTSIETSAFFEGKFETVTIPKSMTYINPNAFYMCNVLKDVYYNGTKVEWAMVTGGSYAVNITTPTLRVVTIHCSDGIFTYTVTFDPNGGTVTPATATTGEDGKLASWPTPTREGYTFKGWYTAAEGGSQVTTNAIFIDDTTLYAQWTQNSAVGNVTGRIAGTTLYITGSGPMEDFNGSGAVPWYNRRKEITSTVISDQVTSIGGWAFYDCANLTSVTIPTNVTIIGESAFCNCTSLTDIYFGGTTAQWNTLAAAAGVPSGVTVHCSDGDRTTT